MGYGVERGMEIVHGLREHAEQMSRYLGDLGYGNQDIVGPIDHARDARAIAGRPPQFTIT